MTTYRSRLRLRDAVGGAFGGVRARPWRSILSALGIAIGVAAAVGVVGISASSRAHLLAQLGAQANILTASTGQTMTGAAAPLPLEAEAMVARIAPVDSVSATGFLRDATVRRTAAIPAIESGGITVLASRINLLETLGGRVARGTFLNAATERYPAVVLGALAARTLGISTTAVGTQVYVGDHYFTVVGILAAVPLAPEIDQSALVGFPVANDLLGLGGYPSRIYLRAAPDQVQAVASVLPFTVNPAEPEAVQISRPSEILTARAKAGDALSGLLLGLMAVALAVGGVGIANIMVIAVLERQGEIGLRRALGATRRHIATQFLAEAVLLALGGGIGGLLIGIATTAATALTGGQPIVVPLTAAAGGVAVAVGVGIAAGVYPAVRAARMVPATALRAV